MVSDTEFYLGTRASSLATWQTDYVIELLRTRYPEYQFTRKVISTKGDRVLDTPLPLVGGKGLFTLELEDALRNGDIHFAVHSLKDLPTESARGLTIGAIPQRADPADALVGKRNYTLDTLPSGAVVGTSSRRRAAQLLHYRPDLVIQDIRGNVETRIEKTLDPEGPYTATILACAGLQRLDLMHHASQILPLDVMLPAPGQGALAVQCVDDIESVARLRPITHKETHTAVSAERAFLARLEGGCSVPVAAYATVRDGRLAFRGRVAAVDGSEQIDVSLDNSLQDPEVIGRSMAEEAIARGADLILERVQQHG